MSVPGRHFHPEYWTEVDHNRYEDRTAREIHELRNDVKALGQRISWLLGAIGVLVFVINLIAPLISRMLGLPS